MESSDHNPNDRRSPKRDQLVEAAVACFQREGYRGACIDRILEEAGVAKMTLYNHFTSKDELVLAALRLSDERFRDWMARRVRELAGAGTDPEAGGRRVLAVFDALGEWFATEAFRGCLFARACQEFPDPEHPARRAAQEHQRLLRRWIVGLCAGAGAARPEKLADGLMLIYAGAVSEASMGGDGAEIARRARAVGEGLLASETRP